MSSPASLRTIARLADGTDVGAWMLTADLAEWDLDELTGFGDSVENWRFDDDNERVALMKPGDPCVLWVYGSVGGEKVAGLWAIGEIASEPFETDESDTDDDADVEEDDEWAEREIYIDLDLQFFADPISRATLQADARFRKAVILHRPDTPEPLPLTPAEYAFIEEHLDENGLWPDDPESDAVLDAAEAAAIAHLEQLGMTIEQRDEPPYLVAVRGEGSDGGEGEREIEVLIAPTTSADEFVLGASEFDDLATDEHPTLLVVVVFGDSDGDTDTDTAEPRVAHVLDEWRPDPDHYDRATQLYRV